MWDAWTFFPSGVQSLFCPSRASESLLLAIAFWILGACFGSFITAICLSPLLRRVLAKVFAVVVFELSPIQNPRREDRLARYRN